MVIISGTASPETVAHYNRPEVMETILRVSITSNFLRWAVGDSKAWYVTATKGKKFPQPMDSKNYKELARCHRTIYATLSYFSPETYEIELSSIENREVTRLSKEQVRAYTFGIDIDSIDKVNGHGANITDPEVKEAVEVMAKFFIKKLREYAPNSVYALFSGGGVYIFLHHGVFEDYFTRITSLESPGYVEMVEYLADALNALIKTLSDEFFLEFPQYKPYVKADELNQAKRIFKTIYSVHKKHPYAVIPLDVDNPVIDFELATLPLKDEVLEAGKNWYTEYDSDNGFLIFLKPYLEEARETKLKRISQNAETGEVEISKGQFSFCDFPPCVKNIISRQTGGAGATRALAFLASFLGQIGFSEEEAYRIWIDVAKRWGATTANVFESWFRRMNCPSCRTLRTPGSGYPRIDIVEMKACKSDIRCHLMRMSSPVCYVDREFYKSKLRRDLCR